METSLSLEEFKKLALQYQSVKKKAQFDFNNYVLERSYRIKKRCKYSKNAKISINKLFV